MKEYYGVYFGSQIAGKVQIQRQGLYYHFFCRCKLTGDVVCRLQVSCGNRKESLGIVVPVNDGFGLETKLPVKKLGEGNMEFQLVPKHEVVTGTFYPIYPEEPFAYISRLKEAYLSRKGDQIGIMLKT